MAGLEGPPAGLDGDGDGGDAEAEQQHFPCDNALSDALTAKLGLQDELVTHAALMCTGTRTGKAKDLRAQLAHYSSQGSKWTTADQQKAIKAMSDTLKVTWGPRVSNVGCDIELHPRRLGRAYAIAVERVSGTVRDTGYCAATIAILHVAASRSPTSIAVRPLHARGLV
jgi:hypothetical protein